MSGSSPGDVSDDPDDPDDASDRIDGRDRRDRAPADGSPPAGGPSKEAGRGSGNGVTIEDDGVVHWFLHSDDGTVVFVRDVASSVAIVAVIGLILFGVSGVWPPLVAVESGSMEPNMHRGDLIFVVEDDRYVGDGATDGTGVVALENGRENGHDKFGNPGDVIVFQPNGNERQTPIIHRAHFWVEEDEEWVDTKADEDIVGDATCDQVATCPADHAGFITKGDANPTYDQLAPSRTGGVRTDVVKPEWVTGKAMFRVPWLGNVRLTFDDIFGGMLAPTPSTGLEYAGPAGPASPGAAGMPAGIAGATGLAAAGGGLVTAIGRRRN